MVHPFYKYEPFCFKKLDSNYQHLPFYVDEVKVAIVYNLWPEKFSHLIGDFIKLLCPQTHIYVDFNLSISMFGPLIFSTYMIFYPNFTNFKIPSPKAQARFQVTHGLCLYP